MNESSRSELPIAEALAQLDAEVLAVIRNGVARRTTSISSFGDITTGNAYQSITLRDETIAGFRRDDPHLFAGIQLSGQRFVDLGCNFGEKTRLAAGAGAKYAEGIEYEEYFVRLGCLINAYNGAYNVSIRQGDITKPGCLLDDFDVAGCFSAFVYMRQNFEEIAGKIKRLLVLETHAMDESWYRQYVVPIREKIPHWVFLGFTDHGISLNRQRRGLMVFGRDRGDILGTSLNRAEILQLDHHDVQWIELEDCPRPKLMLGKSDQSHQLFARMRVEMKAVAPDAKATVIQLLERYTSELRGLLPEAPTDVGFESDAYWCTLFAGVLHLLKRGVLTAENPYVAYMMSLNQAGAYDAGMAFDLSTEDRAVKRLGPRLETTFRTLLTKQIDHPTISYNPLAIDVLATQGYTALDGLRVSDHLRFRGKGEFRIQYMDGNNRLAALWLSGADACPTLPFWTNVFGLESDQFALFKNPDARSAEIVESILASTVLAF